MIYDAINEIEAALKGMLAPKYQEVVIGHAEVRQTYKVSAIGTIAGCYVKDGKVTRDAQVRPWRDHIVLHQGAGPLQRFKDSVKEVTAGYSAACPLTGSIKEGATYLVLRHGNQEIPHPPHRKRGAAVLFRLRPIHSEPEFTRGDVPMASNRIGRINEEIQRELASLLRNLKDPRCSPP